MEDLPCNSETIRIEELVSERDLFLRRLWIFAGFMIGQFGQIVIMDLLRNRMCRINEDIFEQASFCLRDVREPPTHRCPLGKWVSVKDGHK